MPFTDANKITCEILVIGGGGAGLKAAIIAREMGADVLVASKTRVGYVNNTFISKAAFAATGWGDPQDSQGVHVKDTVVGGRFLNDQELVGVMAGEAGAQVLFLEKCGVSFMRKGSKIWLDHHPGHSYPRSVLGEHRRGSGLVLPLKEYARKIGVRFADRVFITRLFTSSDRIAAATGVTGDGVFLTFVANCVILATGGYAHAYLHTNNAPGISGDGQALAFNLNVPLKDIEFVQFYPTATGKFGSRLLLYEVFVLYAGAKLRNAKGEDIIVKHGISDPIVLTRDRLSRAIAHEISEGLDVEGGVVMDLKPVPEKKVAKLQPLLPSKSLEGKKEIVVSPTTHFCMGGIIIDKKTETAVPGLFGAGEICAGVHGANRLSGNALSEVFAMGGIAGREAAGRSREMGPPEIPAQDIADEKRQLGSCLFQTGRDPKILYRALKEMMWTGAGIVRHRAALEKALAKIEELRVMVAKSSIKNPRELTTGLELQNMLLISEMICRAALMRRESRGSHYRSDYPDEDNAHWLKNIVIRKDGAGMRSEGVPVSLEWVGPASSEL
ncbi:MAG: FAD-binding protein [Desulfobacteraceae bacterium]|jgi:succinate dehydrogenase/fumarate reductase flavoprotein subunit